jgi:hypothetical protein
MDIAEELVAEAAADDEINPLAIFTPGQPTSHLLIRTQKLVQLSGCRCHTFTHSHIIDETLGSRTNWLVM